MAAAGAVARKLCQNVVRDKNTPRVRHEGDQASQHDRGGADDELEQPGGCSLCVLLAAVIELHDHVGIVHGVDG